MANGVPGAVDPSAHGRVLGAEVAARRGNPLVGVPDGQDELAAKEEPFLFSTQWFFGYGESK